MIDRTPYSVAPYGEDQYKKNLGPSDGIREGRLHLCLSGCCAGAIYPREHSSRCVRISTTRSPPQDVDDSSDMYDTLEFLLKRGAPTTTAKAGIWGISYPGFYTSASIIDSHPALKAASPQAPMTNLFKGGRRLSRRSLHARCKLRLLHFLQTVRRAIPCRKHEVPFEMGTPKRLRFFICRLVPPRISTRNISRVRILSSTISSITQPMTITGRPRDLAPHMKNVKCAVLVVGGWFDCGGSVGPVQHLLRNQQIQPGNNHHAGRRAHGSMADGHATTAIISEMPNSTRRPPEFFRKNIQFPFFEYYLKGKGSPLPKAYVFGNRKQMYGARMDAWPPAQAKPKTLYFHANGKLSFDPPAGKEGSDEYVQRSGSSRSLRRITRPIPCHNVTWWTISASHPPARTCWSIRLSRSPKM